MLRKTSFLPSTHRCWLEQQLQSLELVLVPFSAYVSDIIMRTQPLSDPQKILPLTLDTLSYEILSLYVVPYIAWTPKMCQTVLSALFFSPKRLLFCFCLFSPAMCTWCAKQSRDKPSFFSLPSHSLVPLCPSFACSHLQVNTSVFSLQVLHLTKQHHWNLQLHCHTRVYWCVSWPRPQHMRLQPSGWGEVWLQRRPLVPVLPVNSSSSQ